MSTRCALVQPMTRGSEGRLVCGDATSGDKDSIVCTRRRSAREETSTGPGLGKTHVHLKAKNDEEEWVELLDEFKKFGKYAELKRW